MPKRVTRFICKSKSIFFSIIFWTIQYSAYFRNVQTTIFILVAAVIAIFVGTTKYSTLPYRINWRWMKKKIIIRLIIGNIRYRNLFQTNYGLIKKVSQAQNHSQRLTLNSMLWSFLHSDVMKCEFFFFQKKKKHFQIFYFVCFHVGMPS